MNAAFAWPGGKKALTRTLLSLLPAHSRYVEVFAGSAKLLFAKEPARMEVINDLNGEVINFYRVAKHRPAELAEMLERECIHAGRFRELLSAQPVCEVERAMKFAYLAWYSFGAKGEHFASSTAKDSKIARPLTRVRDLFADVSQRLHTVKIEQRDFAEILARYDAADTLFYLDPPYVCFQPNGRYKPLEEDRRAALFDQLAQLKGKFILSFDDHPEIRRRSKQHGFCVRSESVTYTLAGNRGTKPPKFKEVLVANFAIAG